MKKRYLGVIVFLVISTVANANNTIIENGLIDLRGHNWKNDGIVNLTGNWEFYWNQFYSPAFLNDSSDLYKKNYSYVPSFWNNSIPNFNKNNSAFGYATYHVKVLCPTSSEKLALKFLTVESAYRLYINGKQVAQVGQPAQLASKTVSSLKPMIIPVTPENNILDIVIQVSNFDNRVGGLWDFIKLGTTDQIQTNFISNISLQFFVAGCFFVAGIYYLILFLPFKNRYTLLYFSILCFIICIRSLVVGEMPLLQISNFSWETARRLEYITIFLSVPVMCLFSYYLFPEDFSKKALYIFIPVTGLFLLVSLFGSYYYYTYTIRYYEMVMMIAAFYGLFVYVKAAMNKRKGSVLFLTGFFIFLVTVINDILNVNLLIKTIPMFYIGLGVFVLILSFLLSGQFSETFNELQVANSKLSYANNELEKRNNEIVDKNKELNTIYKELDSFVNRTSHDLRAPLTSVLSINKVAKEEKDQEVFREYLSIQENTLKRMDNLITDIIDFSKNKRLELDLREINFEQIVANSLDDHAFLNNAQRIEKKVHINQYEKFISDPRRISIIINNLLSNAIKYSDSSKDKQEIDIDISVVDNMATIEVADNGIGIEEEHLDKIFTLFYRATNITTGSGLGLYIIKETVERLSGYVIINSRKGDGTSIKVIIPNMGYKL